MGDKRQATVAALVCHREAVLDLSAQALDEQQPVICVDERAGPLLADTRQPQLMRPGMANLLLAVQPRAGWRRLNVSAPYQS